MAKHILITGGAGFIGSHLADELLSQGYRVRALDNLCSQVHSGPRMPPEYLHEDVELVIGDVRDPAVVRHALDGIDAVYHFAAGVGVGQSMYQIANYTSINNLGTAVLLEALIERMRDRTHRTIERLIVASSMSIYGEGLYRSPNGEISDAMERTTEQLARREWEVRNNRNEVLTPVPTAESKPPNLASVYALSKFDQERMSLILGRAYGISTVALRFFNVYGTRQALSNPYTGVLAIFAARLLNGKPPMIFEDGQQKRDFVSVYDVARACLLALEVPEAGGRVFNVGSGKSFTVLEIATRLAEGMGREYIEPEITGRYRVGDIRHCFSDIRLARRVMGYEPRVTLESGLEELAHWLESQHADDQVAGARAELESRGLTI